MYLLTDIALANWYLIRREQIRIRGAAALVGPTGAGKSTIFDAVGTVLAGNNASRLALNASASGRSARTVRDYCLGWISDPAEGGRPTREACETILCLTFENAASGRVVSIGLALAARAEESREETLSRFIAVGHRFEIDDYVRATPEGSFVAPWSEIAADLRARADRFEEFRTSGERFTAEVMAALREGAPAPEPRHFLRTFSNAVAFKPIFDSSAFVRAFVLEPEPLDVARIRGSVETWRRLLETIEELERRLGHLARIVARYEAWADLSLAAALDELRAAGADLRRRVLEHDGARTALAAVTDRLRIAREAVRGSQGFVREIEAEIAERKALLAAGAAKGRLAASNAGLALIARERRDLAARVADLVGLVQDAGKLSAVAGTLRTLSPDAARLVAACARSGLRRDAAPEESLRADGTLGSLLAAIAALPDVATALDAVADDLALSAREREREAQALSADVAAGGTAVRLSSDTAAFRDELGRLGIGAVPICELAEITDPTWDRPSKVCWGGRGRRWWCSPTVSDRPSASWRRSARSSTAASS